MPGPSGGQLRRSDLGANIGPQQQESEHAREETDSNPLVQGSVPPASPPPRSGQVRPSPVSSMLTRRLAGRFGRTPKGSGRALDEYRAELADLMEPYTLVSAACGARGSRRGAGKGHGAEHRPRGNYIPKSRPGRSSSSSAWPRSDHDRTTRPARDGITDFIKSLLGPAWCRFRILHHPGAHPRTGCGRLGGR